MLSIPKGIDRSDFDRNHGNGIQLIMSDLRPIPVQVRDKL